MNLGAAIFLDNNIIMGIDLFEKNNDQAFVYMQKAANMGMLMPVVFIVFLRKWHRGCKKSLKRQKNTKIRP